MYGVVTETRTLLRLGEPNINASKAYEASSWTSDGLNEEKPDPGMPVFAEHVRFVVPEFLLRHRSRSFASSPGGGGPFCREG